LIGKSVLDSRISDAYRYIGGSSDRQIGPFIATAPDDTEGTRGRRLFTTFGNRQCARDSSHIFPSTVSDAVACNAYSLEYGGRSSPALKGGETGHLLRRLSIAISLSVGGSEAS